jgi:uncharacterized protein YbjT (DUF2867 family)
MFLVTGSTGNVGAELARALLRANQRVRTLVHVNNRPDLSAGAELIAGDLDRPETLRAAMAGVQGIFLLPGYRDMLGVLAEARRAGVERVVQLSGGSAASGDTTNAISRYMIASEAAVRESGLPWTILRPSAFMSNALRWKQQLLDGEEVRVPFANIRTAVVDPFDVAAVAAEALLSDRHEGRIYAPTGPESLLPADQVRILASVLGRTLRFQAQSNDEARIELAKTTRPEYVDAFFDFYVAGSLDESRVRTTVEDVTGRAPRTFEQWATAHADDFR